MNSNKTNMDLTEKEIKLIELLRKIPYGKITIIKHDGEITG